MANGLPAEAFDNDHNLLQTFINRFILVQPTAKWKERDEHITRLFIKENFERIITTNNDDEI
jgi:hypothetical protein